MSNPLDDFYAQYGEPQEKVAFGGEAAKGFGHAMTQGLGMAAAGVAFAGAGMAAGKIYDAATKSHDFKQILELNPDLHEHHERDPKMFNQMYSSLRNMNPNFAKDPIVAGTYLRRMADNPMSAGGILTESLSASDKFKSPMADSWRRGGEHAGNSFAESLKPKVVAKPYQRRNNKGGQGP